MVSVAWGCGGFVATVHLIYVNCFGNYTALTHARRHTHTPTLAHMADGALMWGNDTECGWLREAVANAVRK